MSLWDGATLQGQRRVRKSSANDLNDDCPFAVFLNHSVHLEREREERQRQREKEEEEEEEKSKIKNIIWIESRNKKEKRYGSKKIRKRERK